MPDGLSDAEAGRVAGVSRVAIFKAKKTGHLPSLPNGKISAEALDKWINSRRAPRVNRTQVNKVTVNKKPGAEKIVREFLADPDADPETAAAALTAHGIFRDRAKAELWRDSYAARLAQLKFEREAGKVVEVEHVARIVGESLARVRSKLMAIPAEQAPQLHRCRTVNALQDLLLEVITEALEELVTEAALAARRD
jgi:hypothetical protein